MMAYYLVWLQVLCSVNTEQAAAGVSKHGMYCMALGRRQEAVAATCTLLKLLIW
jgi:hypothetical protein